MPSASSLRKPIVLLAFAAGMVALGISVARVPGAADGARQALESAKVAIEAGDEDAAMAAVERARDHVDTVQLGVQGPVGVVGQWIPGVGTSVRDVRHLGDALDSVASVAELGAKAYPEIAGDNSTFFTDDQVDLPTLDRLVDTARDAQAGLTVARESLDQIEASGPGSAQIGMARDDALAQVTPLLDGLTDSMPLLEQLPTILGAEGERKYLVAILNPSELLYSGGTALSYAPMSVNDGRVEVGATVDGSTGAGMFGDRFWRKVKGNPFHRGRLKVPTAAKAPSWPVAGEEMLNAWRSIRGRNMAGVIAVDMVALDRLLAITGPLEVPGFGRVEAGNLVETVVGSYDKYQDTTTRRALNRALVPVFRDRLFDGAQLSEKASILHQASQGRHFALYFRDDQVQAAFDELGMTGDLSDTEHDYLGVFTQNAVASKTDYWQKRIVRSRVRLARDGSAQVRLQVRIHNDTPPYALPGVDPRTGYNTRWLFSSIGVFLPKAATVTSAAVRGKPFDFNVGDYFGRPFVRRTVTFPPQSRGDLVLHYRVPSAAVVTDQGSLSYRLDLDPQGMVHPESVSATVQFPTGFTLDALPEGWQASGPRSATWSTDALDDSPRLTLSARDTAPTP